MRTAGDIRLGVQRQRLHLGVELRLQASGSIVAARASPASGQPSKSRAPRFPSKEKLVRQFEKDIDAVSKRLPEGAEKVLGGNVKLQNVSRRVLDVHLPVAAFASAVRRASAIREAHR